MSVSKVDFEALKVRLAALEAEVATLKSSSAPPAPSKKEKKAKKEPNAAQLLSKAWMQHCLEKYTYPSEMKEAEDKKHSETGKTDGLLIHRNHVAFAKSMQSTHESDYAEWKSAHAPAPAEESATESAPESGTEKKRGRKPKAAPAAPAAPATPAASSAPAAPSTEEEPVVPVPAPGGRKVVKKSTKKE